MHFKHAFEKTSSFIFVSQESVLFFPPVDGKETSKSNAHVLPSVFQYIQDSGYHPQFIATTSAETKKWTKKKQLRVRVVVKWLGFGCRWCWKLSEWELGLMSTVQRQPLIYWIASVQKRFAYAALSLFLCSSPPQAQRGPTWDTTVQCKVYTVLYSTGTP